MSKKENKCVPSRTGLTVLKALSEESEDDYFSQSEEEEETVEVNGFQVLVSQESQVREMFEKHPDLTSNFDVKNQKIKNAYMDVLLDLIDTLWMSTKDLSLEDLNKANSTLFDLTRVGLNVGWLCQKLDAAYLKKEKRRVGKARIRELEEQVKNRKLALSDLESDLKKAKAAATTS